VIRVVLPAHLRTLARVTGDVLLEVPAPVTQRSVLDALEAAYPALRGTVRDHVTLKRRAFVRFFACQEDLSHDPPDAPLPASVAAGDEPFFIIGAVAGGLDAQGRRSMGREQVHVDPAPEIGPALVADRGLTVKR
jgi:molybdopterin synthase sulfur carrier subunit